MMPLVFFSIHDDGTISIYQIDACFTYKACDKSHFLLSQIMHLQSPSFNLKGSINRISGCNILI